MDLKFYPNPVENVLNLTTTLSVDYVRLYDKHGQLVDQFIPVDNKINLNRLKAGFYLACAYKEERLLKKSIIKKI